MPRNITASFRKAAESQWNDEVDLVFLTISHPLLLEPVRVVWDAVDFIWGGNTFIGFPFDIQILSDDEQPPRASLAFQNVDQVIGETIRGLNTPPRMQMDLLSSVDFNLAVTPRTQIGTPTVFYTASRLFLVNVRVDVLQITADIVGWNYLQRVWPGVRATQAAFPGLFR